MEARRKKTKKDLDTIVKLRLELSKLRQLRNKMRRREYNRKAKHEKVLERRKKRRQFIQQQIELGVMDKSQLSLVYSRKKLPYEQEHNKILSDQKNKKDIHDRSAAAYQQVSNSTNLAYQPSATIMPTPTVEYIIKHDGQIDNSPVIGETVVEVGNYYETITSRDAVTDQETHAAVAGISSDAYQQDIDQVTRENVSTNSGISYTTVANEHEYTNAASQKYSAKPVSIIQLQHHSRPKGSIINTKESNSANVEECSQEHLDFIVKVSL